MKRPGLTPCLLAATLFLVPSLRAEETKPAAPAPAAATPAPAPAMGAMKGGRDAELLKRFDKNGDGKLDDDERADAKDAMMKEQMDRQAARAAVLGGAEQERAKMLELFDKNKDGKLDDEERAAAEKFARERAAANPGGPGPGRGAGGGGAMRAEIIRRLDKNGDGKIDEVERADGVTYIAANLNQFPGLKQRFDKNGDGKLDNEEQIALDEGLRQLTQEGGPGRGFGLGAAGPMPSFESLPPQIREQALKRFDKDGDGKLTGDELTALQAEMTRRRQGRTAQNGGAPAPAAAKTEESRVADKEEEAKLNQALEQFAPKLDVAKPAPTPAK